MKRHSNKKEYLAIAVIVAIVVAIGFGSSNMMKKTNEERISEAPRNLSTERPVDEVLQVDINKNNPVKIDIQPKGKEIKDTVDEVIKEPVEEPDKESVIVDIYEEATAMENEITFIWPVNGKIVMDFSPDKTVFDPTLEQYRTNASICIASEAGADVKATCDGTVKRVFKDYEKGMTVVINHADGWSTTYSQLEEKVAVKEGDMVKKGSVIGQVSMPTKYSTALGAHLEFQVAQNEYVIDPKVAIVE